MIKNYFHDDSPTWEDVKTTPSAALRWLKNSPIPAAVLRMRHKGKHMPFVALIERSDTFSSPINQSTSVNVFFDVVTAVPFPTPFAYVVPVLFDDPRNPYWATLMLSLFPQRDFIENKELREALAENTMNLVACMASTNRCGFVVINEEGEVLKDEIISFDQTKGNRSKEILDILDFIHASGQERTKAESEAPLEIFERVFCFLTTNKDGGGLVIPKGRSLKEKESLLIPVMVDHGRLINRIAVHNRAKEPAPDIDLFMSHAHADSFIVDRLSKWIAMLWPNLKIGHTHPNEEERFRNEPTYFLSLARRSRCLLYIATPNSIMRPMPDTEIGICSDKPIVSLCIGNVSPSDLKQKSEDSLFLVLDEAFIVDGCEDEAWIKLARLLARILDLDIPHAIDPPDLQLKNTVMDNSNNSAYLYDWITISNSIYGIRDEKHAQIVIVDQILADATREGGDPNRIKSLLENFPVRSNLLALLVTRPKEVWRTVLELFPPLLDRELLIIMQMLKSESPDQLSTPIPSGLQHTVEMCVMENTLLQLQQWEFVRGEDHHHDLGFHPKALEFYDHTQVKHKSEATFNFGFHKPNGNPPFDAIRQQIPVGDSTKEWFINRLCKRITSAAKQNSHGRVIYETTDFHTGRAANLKGSDWIEARELNPNKGARGLSRYLHSSYQELFSWELETCALACEKVHELYVVFPLVRTPEEYIRGIHLLRTACPNVKAVGFIPEAPINIFQISDFLSAGINYPKQILLLNLRALRSGFDLPENSSETVWKIIESIIAEAQKFANLMKTDIELVISETDANTLCELDAIKAMGIIDRMSILLPTKKQYFKN